MSASWANCGMPPPLNEIATHINHDFFTESVDIEDIIIIIILKRRKQVIYGSAEKLHPCLKIFFLNYGQLKKSGKYPGVIEENPRFR